MNLTVSVYNLTITRIMNAGTSIDLQCDALHIIKCHRATFMECATFHNIRRHIPLEEFTIRRRFVDARSAIDKAPLATRAESRLVAVDCFINIDPRGDDLQIEHFMPLIHSIRT